MIDASLITRLRCFSSLHFGSAMLIILENEGVKDFWQGNFCWVRGWVDSLRGSDLRGSR